MSRKRYTFDAESGLLADRDGNLLGRVIALTFDDAPVVGGVGGGSSTALPSNGNVKDLKQETVTKEGGAGETVSSKRPTASQLELDAIKRVWAYYCTVFESKRVLDDKRKRIIRNALALVGEEAAMKAVLGLSRSPWHRGENDQRRKYTEIRYALKGIGDESDDERIEKAISWAAMYAPDFTGSTASVFADPAKVDRWLEEVRYTLSLPHRPQKERGKEAWNKLSEAGFKVIRLDRPPWARIAR